jgi:ketosteroid isomerase-like protein
MKKAFLVFGLFIVMPALAVNIMPLSPDTPRYEDRQQLRAILVDTEVAINAVDLDAITKHLHPDVVVSWYNGEVSYGIPEVRAYYKRMLIGENALLKDFKTQTAVSKPAVFHGNLAVAAGTSQDSIVFRNGQTYQFNSIWAATIKKTAGMWQVVALHLSVNMPYNQLINELKKMVWQAAVLAFMLGLLLAWWLTRRKYIKRVR